MSALRADILIYMAKRELHARAIEMRKQGMSYTQIRRELQVSKGTLSSWLSGQPLPEERIRELRDHSEVRIEKYRATRARQRNERKAAAYSLAKDSIGTFSDRESFIAGLFLYWGEGGKTQYSSVSMSNTDPAVLIFFKQWLIQLGANPSGIKVRLQLYADMDAENETRYWSEILCLPRGSFRKPYIKDSKRLNLTYKQRFSHGTCNMIYNNLAIAQRILLGIEWIRESFIAGNS